MLVSENSRMTQTNKRFLYATYALIAAAAFAEWLGVQLDGNPAFPEWTLRTVKCVDYVLTPMAGGVFAFQMNLDNRLQKVLNAVLAVNVAFQIVAAFGGWMTVVDASGHYSHGPLYPVYLCICLVIVGLLIGQFIIYGRSFEHQNRKSLYAIMGMLLIAIALQEAIPGVRVEYLAMSVAVVLMFIHSSEFAQLSTDNLLIAQQRALDIDTLTGLRSRYAYAKLIEDYKSQESLPLGLCVFVIDVDDLKGVNDRMGHDAGDDMLCGAADSIRRTFGDSGQCFRTGGDEFAVFVEGIGGGQAEKLMKQLDEEAGKWHGESGVEVKMSAGFARAQARPWANVEELLKAADAKMYAMKSEHHRKAYASAIAEQNAKEPLGDDED